MTDEQSRWLRDKVLPGLVIALVCFAGASGVGAWASLDKRVAQAEAKVQGIEHRLETYDPVSNARIEQRLEDIADRLERVERKIDRRREHE